MKPNVRQGATAGIVMSAVLAVASVASSSRPQETFIAVLVMGLAATGIAVALMHLAAGHKATSFVGDRSIAGFWVRAAAFALDWVQFVLIGLVLAPLGWATQVILLAYGFIYFVGLWGTTGQTLGMSAIGLRVVRVDGSSIGWSNAVRRFFGLCAAFLFLYVGVIWVAFDARKRGWADLVGGTLVIRTN